MKDTRKPLPRSPGQDKITGRKEPPVVIKEKEK
jgi:hypothetical protein